MPNRKFRNALKNRLAAREGQASHVVGNALVAAGLSVDEARRILQTVGSSLTWSLWEIALDEAAALVA